MVSTPCVVLYGNSVFLAGIRAGLRECAGLELVTIEPSSPDAAGRIASLEPAVILFDLAAGRPDFALSLLQQRPALVLIGVDPSSDKMLVLSGREEQPASAVDLVQMITGNSADASP